jgi:hypothetical protein
VTSRPARGQALLNKVPQQRLSCAQLLEHPFVRETADERAVREARRAAGDRLAAHSRGWKGEGTPRPPAAAAGLPHVQRRPCEATRLVSEGLPACSSGQSGVRARSVPPHGHLLAPPRKISVTSTAALSAILRARAPAKSTSLILTCWGSRARAGLLTPNGKGAPATPQALPCSEPRRHVVPPTPALRGGAPGTRGTAAPAAQPLQPHGARAAAAARRVLDKTLGVAVHLAVCGMFCRRVRRCHISCCFGALR